MLTERRTYTAEFKKTLVEQVLYRSASVTQLSRQHNVHRVLIYRWVQQYRRTGKLKSTESHPSSHKPSVEQLEALVGRLMIDNELLKKALSEMQAADSSKGIISGTTEITLDR